MNDDAVRARAEAMWAEDRASIGLGMRLDEVAPGHARLSMTITEAMANGHGICHGGLIFTLAGTPQWPLWSIRGGSLLSRNTRRSASSVPLMSAMCLSRRQQSGCMPDARVFMMFACPLRTANWWRNFAGIRAAFAPSPHPPPVREGVMAVGLDAIETASRDEIAALQLERLAWTLRHAYANVPHYRARFDAAGVHPDDFRHVG